MRIIAVVNQKGGVGKTTTAVNLSAALAKAGERVLLVDSDPQGNASSGLGFFGRDRLLSTYDVLVRGQPVSRAIRRTDSDANLHVVPANRELVAAELKLAGVRNREAILGHALGPVAGDYAYVLIDCPPSLGLLTVNALSAANALLVPVQCEFYALEGLAQLMDTVRWVRQRLNPALAIDGVLLTMYARLKLANQVAAEARKKFHVYRTVVPRNVSLSEAPSHGQSVLDYDPKSKGAKAYIKLAREISANGRKP